MDLEWNDERTRKFVSALGLITSDGPHGPNVMAAEWARHVSYAPSLMALNLKPSDATCDNIRETKEFGINLASSAQNVLASAAGGSSGRSVDKIEVLKGLGAEFYGAKRIRAPMLRGAAMNAECRLVQETELGDHIMFVGEVLEISSSDAEPLAYHGGRYFRLGEQLHKPPKDALDRIASLVDRHRKK